METVGKRYLLQTTIGRGGMGAVYRALDRLTGQVVALKRVTAPSEQLIFASVPDLNSRASNSDFRLALAQEFRTLASLRHPHIISVLDYGFDEQLSPYFTMDLLEEARSILEIQLPINGKMRLIGQVLQALAYLHRRNILHRDLKPGNVMVTNSGEVKVLDFGLAVEKQVSSDPNHKVAGTLAYLAPEVLQGGETTPASDLYAVGLMMYELVCGHHPFDTTQVGRLIESIVHMPPDVEILDIDEGLRDIIQRLLLKSPDDRYQSAGEVLAALSAATGEPLQVETTATRESFLQAAQFVGRERELDTLIKALENVIEGQQTNLWLIGGESGVGKSRLLEEVRTLALVKGLTVLRGQAVSEGGVPYQMWRDALRWLALQGDLSDLEAGTLKAIIPDIETLISRDVPVPPVLSPQGAQERLMQVIEALFSRYAPQGTVVVLEDVHWAGSESLALLSRLTGTRLFLLGSYRDDERPLLPDELDRAQVLKLSRLNTDQITGLSESMLGAAGRLPQVVTLLERETEGNVFFLVEVVRALAEEAGSLERIGTQTLPEKVFASGVQSIVRRRLERVPEANRPLLQIAAVAGRHLDLTLLQAVAGKLELQTWLGECANAAVLDVSGGWRFAHDKLREGLLADLNDSQRRSLHQTVAETLEQVYDSGQVAALAYHWSEAGVLPKAIHFLEKAADQSISNGAYQAAVDHLLKALHFNEQVNTADETQLAYWHQQLSEAYTGLGESKNAREHATKTVALLGYAMPRGTGRLIAGILTQSAVQVAHRLFPMFFLRKQDAKKLLQAAHTYERINQADYYSNRFLAGIYGVLRALNLAEAAGQSSPELARCLTNFALLFSVIPVHRLAGYYARRARQIAYEVDDLSARSWTLQVTSIFYISIADWSKVAIDEALELARQMGDHRRMAEMSVLPTWGIALQGQFKEALGRYQQALEVAKHRADKQTYVWALQGTALTLMRLGRTEEALQYTTDPKLIWLSSLVHLRQGNYDQAEAVLTSLAKRMKHRPMQVYQFDLYATVAEVWVGLLEACPTPSRQQSTEIACETLRRYGHIFPVTQPRALVWSGTLAWLNGREDKARKLWQQSLKLAREMQLPYEEGLAHYELGRHGSRENLLCAAEIFEKLGVGHELNRIRAVLNAGHQA